jgi:hypothetical protein
MPFKHHAARRHRIPQARYRVRNWRAYDTAELIEPALFVLT